MSHFNCLLVFATTLVLFFGVLGCSTSENSEPWALQQPKLQRQGETPQSLSTANNLWNHYKWTDQIEFIATDLNQGVLLETSAACSTPEQNFKNHKTRRALTAHVHLYELLSTETIHRMDQMSSSEGTNISCRFSFRAQHPSGSEHHFFLERRNLIKAEVAEPIALSTHSTSKLLGEDKHIYPINDLQKNSISSLNTSTSHYLLSCTNYISAAVDKRGIQSLAQLYTKNSVLSRTLEEEACRVLGLNKRDEITEISRQFFIRNNFLWPDAEARVPSRLLIKKQKSPIRLIPPIPPNNKKRRAQTKPHRELSQTNINLGTYRLQNKSDQILWLELPTIHAKTFESFIVWSNSLKRKNYRQVVPMKTKMSWLTKPRLVKGLYVRLRPNEYADIQLTGVLPAYNCAVGADVKGFHIYANEQSESLRYFIYAGDDVAHGQALTYGYLAPGVDIWALYDSNLRAINTDDELQKSCRFKFN